MRYLIALVLFLAMPVQAFDLYQSGDFWNSYGYEKPISGQQWYDYYDQRYPPKVTHSRANIFGGEDFYGNRGYMGSTRRNIFGGRDFRH